MARDKRQSFFSSEFNLTAAVYITPSLVSAGVPLSYTSVPSDTIPPAPQQVVGLESAPQPKQELPNKPAETGATVLRSPFNVPFKTFIGGTFMTPRPTISSYPPSIHAGLDLDLKNNGLDLYACASGKVTVIYNNPGCDWVKTGGQFAVDSRGNRIRIPGSNGTGTGYGLGIKALLPGYSIRYFYFHMAAPPTLKGKPLKEGDVVTIGDHLGFMGNTGNSDGPHLHFQICQDYPAIRTVNRNKVEDASFIDPRTLYTALGKQSEFVPGFPP